jgi:hypothetical protein
MFIAASFTITKLYKMSSHPTTDEWIKKNVVFIYHGISFNHKEE